MGCHRPAPGGRRPTLGPENGEKIILSKEQNKQIRKNQADNINDMASSMKERDDGDLSPARFIQIFPKKNVREFKKKERRAGMQLVG